MIQQCVLRQKKDFVPQKLEYKMSEASAGNETCPIL